MKVKNKHDTAMMLNNHLIAFYNSNINITRLHQLSNRFSRRMNGHH